MELKGAKYREKLLVEFKLESDHSGIERIEYTVGELPPHLLESDHSGIEGTVTGEDGYGQRLVRAAETC